MLREVAGPHPTAEHYRERKAPSRDPDPVRFSIYSSQVPEHRMTAGNVSLVALGGQ
jgi:hypothetical protein